MLGKKKTLLHIAKGKFNFYRTKAGKNLPKDRKAVMALAREELRILFGR